MKKKVNLLFTLLLLLSHLSYGQQHPSLILTQEGVEQIRKHLGKAELYDQSFQVIQAEVDAAMAQPIEVPVPKDLAGGYTHERHKNNFFILQKAGLLYQITNDERYGHLCWYYSGDSDTLYLLLELLA